MRSTNSVAVLIPPPVLPGHTPTNMSSMVSDCENPVMEFWSIVKNPAVRDVTDWKKELRIFSPTFMSPIVPGLENSAAKKPTAPTRMRAPVMHIMILV